MKFRCKLVGEYASLLHNVFQTLDKVGPETVLHLSPDSVHLTTFPSNEGASAYVSIDPSVLFYYYRVESKSNNNILIKFQNKIMSKALAGSNKATNVLIQLSKKDNNPIFSIIIEMTDLITVTQEAPISLVDCQDTALYDEPTTEPPEIMIDFPSLDIFKHFFTTMKITDSFLYIKGNKDGQLLFKVLSDSMTIETRFADLAIHNKDNTADKREVEIKVDAKYFAKMLGYGYCQPGLGNDSLVFHCVIIQNSLTLTYYLAVLESL